MKNSFSFLILIAISLVLILVVVAYYLFSKITASSKPVAGQAAGGDTLRQHGVTDLASKISYLTGDSTISWPTEWQQIGSGAAGCSIDTVHCKVTAEQCFNLEALTHNKFKLPIDSVEGTAERTGYAVRLLNDKLEITACYADGATDISQELRL